MLRYIKNINRIMGSLRNSSKAFISTKNWSKATIALGLTVVILAGLFFSTSSVTAVNKPNAPGYQASSGFGYGSTTITVSNTTSLPVTTLDHTSKYTIPWWGWLIAGVVFGVLVAFWWRDFTTHKAKDK